MKNLLDNLKKFKEYWLVITFVLSLVFGGTWVAYSRYDEFMEKQEEIFEQTKTTQQMALKSIIWNDNIPLPDRTNACDVYINAGYNSLTKKHCNKIIEEDTTLASAF